MKLADCRVMQIVLLVMGLVTGMTGLAQDTPETEEDAPTVPIEPGPEDALNRGTPRSSIIGFLETCSEFDFEKASEYLDLRNLPRNVSSVSGEELARQLNHVLSRSAWLDKHKVSNRPEGTKGDGLPEFRDELVVIKTYA